jgi:chemotaxis family two-component system sensor kinase Cph1
LTYFRAGQANYTFQPVDLNGTVKQTLEALETRMIETGTVVRVPCPLPTVKSDPILVAEVFTNLTSNAIKYNDWPAGERWVEIGWDNEGGTPVFTVRDNGIGIPETKFEAVFNIFNRLHARHEYGGGNGAGLTITRRTVEGLVAGISGPKVRGWPKARPSLQPGQRMIKRTQP